MRYFTSFMTTSLVLFALSCNNAPSKDETKASDTVAAATDSTVAKPAFTPFNVVNIQPKVKNFMAWENLYVADDSVRKAYGITTYMIARDLRDSNRVYALGKMEDLDKARSYSKLNNLKEASRNSGLIGSLAFSYAQVIRNDETPTEISTRIGIAHHVKDFGIWLKAFDSAAATRASYGLVDRMLARDLMDSNIIYITYLVTDSSKARARLASPELKKIMTDAGVDSPPTVHWYQIVK